MEGPIDLTLGMARTPYVEALFNGTVQPKGIHLTCEYVFSEGLDNTGERHRQILGGTLAGGECSTSSFLMVRTQGADLVALPVFLARNFPHRQIWRHEAATVRTPSDLAGKRVTVHRWNSTSPTWTKGLLQNEYGVDLKGVHWFTAEDDFEGEKPPPDFHIERIPQPATREKAIAMLASGEIDGSLDPYVEEGPGIRRVLPDWKKEAAAFFERRGIYPMSHTLVIRRSILDEHSWVAESLVEAFRAARREAPKYQTEDQIAHERWLQGFLGQDPRLYKLGPVERRTLAELVKYQFQQGLRSQPISSSRACAASRSTLKHSSLSTATDRPVIPTSKGPPRRRTQPASDASLLPGPAGHNAK
ncbi:MAG: 4,5-dihydroxyphthalate decarboxylase [Chloroflexi bacterium]|nr:4,5-dihydroxyphthalate decarboxylase [Chloroflexota bacterium]